MIEGSHKRKSSSWIYVSIGLLLALLWWQTWHVETNNLLLNPLVWTFLGISSGIVILLNNGIPSFYLQNKSRQRWITSILLLLGLMVSCYLLADTIQKFPVDAKMSDVIPSLEVYVQRLLSGEKVYVAIPFEGYEVWPTYFPVMWLPYIVPELIGFDYRWMALFSFFIVYAFVILRTLPVQANLLQVIFIGLFPGLLVFLFDKFDSSVFAFATELMPISFYMLLIYGMFKRNFWIIGITIALCTLSRYAYTLWIIPFVAIIWIAEDFKFIVKIGAVGLCAILLLYVFPFLLKDPAIITDGLAYYGKTAEGQWLPQNWQEEGSVPFHLARGFSFSGFIYESLSSSYLEKLAFAKSLHKIIAFSVSLLFIALYVLLQKRVSWDKFLSVSLFVYLVVFYAFIYVPFSYLFMLPLVVGWLVWGIYGGKDKNLIKLQNT